MDKLWDGSGISSIKLNEMEKQERLKHSVSPLEHHGSSCPGVISMDSLSAWCQWAQSQIDRWCIPWDNRLLRTKRNYPKMFMLWKKQGCRSCFPVTITGSQNEPVAAQVELIISQPNNYNQICGWDKVLHQSRPCARSCSQLCRTSGHARWVHMYTHSYTVYVVRIIVSAFCIWNLEHHILYVFREYIVIPDIHIHLYTVCGCHHFHTSLFF